MTFTHPDRPSANYALQAGVYGADLDVMVAGSATTGVRSGCVVTPSGLSVAVGAGVGVINATDATVGAQTIGPVSPDGGTKYRWYLVEVASNGTAALKAGIAADWDVDNGPIKPRATAGKFVIADILVPPGVVALTANMITPRQVKIAAASGGVVNIQEFVGPAAAAAGGAAVTATWTKPAGAVAVLVEIGAGGGGGGSGARGPSGTIRGGGGGGASGNRARLVFAAADLPATVQVTFGTGGLGGAAKTTDGAGVAGAAGGLVEFGGGYLAASGGEGGEGGLTTDGGAGGTLGTRGMSSGALGGKGGGTATGGTGGGGTLATPDASGGGGGGFGFNAAGTGFEPGAGGVGPNYHQPRIAGGVAATVSSAAGAGAAAGPYAGSGGGGSYRGSASNASPGADGARCAGGGGGGCTANSTVNSGPGGNGGPAFVRVVSYL